MSTRTRQRKATQQQPAKPETVKLNLRQAALMEVVGAMGFPAVAVPKGPTQRMPVGGSQDAWLQFAVLGDDRDVLGALGYLCMHLYNATAPPPSPIEALVLPGR